MIDHREDLRRWIQAAAATTRPVELDDVLNTSGSATDRAPAESTTTEPPIVIDLEGEDPVTNKRNLYLALAAAVAVIALGVYALNRSDGNTSAANPTESTTSTATIPTTPTGTATEFWQALVAGDREQALSLVDPVELDSDEISPHGRAHTLAGQFDWYDAVGWQWQLSACEPNSSDIPICTVAASNAWTEAMGLEPVTGTFQVVVNDDGIVRVIDENRSFFRQWSQQAFRPFSNWVRENHPDDAAIMWADTDVDQEILDLFELNTTRFVEAQTQ